GEAGGFAGPCRAARRGCGVTHRPAVVAGPGAPSAAEPQSATQEGANTGGTNPPARRTVAPAADGHDLRGRTLEQPDLPGDARPRNRSRPQLAGAADRDLPPRVSTALDRPAAGDDADAQPAGPT